MKYALGSAAATVVIVLAITFLWGEYPAPRPTPTEEEVASGNPVRREPQMIRAIVDLRKVGVTRGGGTEQLGEQNVPRLPLANLALTIYLPLGSEEGGYEVAFADSSGEPVASTSGNARFVDFKETLQVNVDLSALSVGQYRLRLRRPESQWTTYDIRLE